MEENDYTLSERFIKRGDAPEVREKRIYGDKSHFAEIPFDYMINSNVDLFKTVIEKNSPLRSE